MYRYINIKKDMPSVDYAVYLLDCEILDSVALNNHVIVVVHGYGSSGEKSKIKSSVHSYCTHLKKMGKIRGFVAGECWSSDAEICKNILRFAPDVEIKENLLAHNSGISIILV